MALRSQRVRGPLHHRLRQLLRDATKAGICTQESLSGAIGKTQTGVGKYLLGKAGTLDVDEAAAALDHIGSSLQEFIAKIPPRELTASDRLARALETRGLVAFVQELLTVPRTRLPAVLDLARTGVYAATGRRGGQTAESLPGSTPGGRTTRAPTKRR